MSLFTNIGTVVLSVRESVINNPFAYRYLILNFDIWKRTDMEVQRAQLEQFLVFIQLSRKKTFNIKRLVKMRMYSWHFGFYDSTSWYHSTLLIGLY